MDMMNIIDQPIKVTEWQQTYTYDSGIHSGMNTQVPSVSSKGLMDEDDLYGKQYTIKKTTTYSQPGSGQAQSQGNICFYLIKCTICFYSIKKLKTMSMLDLVFSNALEIESPEFPAP